MKTPIVVGGEFWSSAPKWATANPEFPLADPANNLVYEGHMYFDKDNSGTYKKPFAQDAATPARVDERLTPFLTWLKDHNAKGLIGEYGAPGTPEWQPVLNRALQMMTENGLASTYWAGGAWWGKYPLSVQPGPDGRDKPQMKLLEKYAQKPLN
jgi:endoglucanase